MLRPGLCSAAGWERGISPEEALSPPRPSLGKQRGSAMGRDGPGCCWDITPAWHSPQGRGAGAPLVAHVARRRVPAQPHGQHRAVEGTRGCLGDRHQAAERIWVSFFPCNPSVLNFFGGFTPNSSDSTANALQSSAQLSSAAAQLGAACNRGRGKGKHQPHKFTHK